MRFELLPSTIENGRVSPKQHLSCFVIDDLVSIDAGSLAMSASEIQKNQIRAVILTHAHIDHVAGLPLFIDDLFSELGKPVDVFATQKVIEVLQTNIFNWDVYPDFAELENDYGPVLKYRPFNSGIAFEVEHLKVMPIEVNHKVPAVGFIISDSKSKIAITGDTSEMDGFWNEVNSEKSIDALLIECAFPNHLNDLAEISHHMTPARLRKELRKFQIRDCPVFVINVKPMYYDDVCEELDRLGIPNLRVLEVGRIYDW